MAQSLVERRRRVDPNFGGPGQPGHPGSRGPGGEGERSVSGGIPRASVGVWLLLAAVGMLFLGFTSSYLSRRTGTDWIAVGMPTVLWFTTALLLASSVVLEWGRFGWRRGVPSRLEQAVPWAAILGVLFLVGQLAAWRALAAAGLFMASNPHASFFYLLTTVHGVHALAGVGWLLVAAVRVRGHQPGAEATVRSGAIYWHFVGLLWVYLWILLFWI